MTLLQCATVQHKWEYKGFLRLHCTFHACFNNLGHCCLICFCKTWTCYQMADHELRGWGERKERQMTCIILCQKLQHHPCQIEINPLNRRRFAKLEWQYCTCPKFARKIPNKFLNLAKESSLGVKKHNFWQTIQFDFSVC